MKRRKETKYTVVHCSATERGQNFDADNIRDWHLKRGWSDVGYHYVIPRDGRIQIGRPMGVIGAHVRGFNSVSVSICLVGGKAKGSNRGENNFTTKQFAALETLLRFLRLVYTESVILGHRDLSLDANGDGKITREEWIKECPCFDVKQFVRDLGI